MARTLGLAAAALLLAGCGALPARAPGGAAGGHSLIAAGVQNFSRSALGGLTNPCTTPGIASPFADLVEIAPGHSAVELVREGYAVNAAVSNVIEAPLNPAARLVSVDAGDSNHWASELRRLQADPTVSRAGMVLAQSRTPGLCSTDYQLSDIPAARPFVHAAEQALVSGHFTTQAALDGDAIFISDDPLDPGMLIFSAQVPTGVTYTQSVAPGVVFMHTRGVIAFVQRATLHVTQAGYDHWEDGE